VTELTIHSDWDTPGFRLAPLAPRVGPFASRPFLETWARHFAYGECEIVEDGTALMVLHRIDDVVEIAGDPDLTDYHSPLGSGVAELVAAYVDQAGASEYRFDSLPDEAAEQIEKGLVLAGLSPATEEHEAAAVLHVAPTWDGVMDALGKKQRHELRRKRRRYEELLGPPALERVEGTEAVARFAALHRDATGEKGEFMTDEMEAFFADLHRDAGAVVDLLVAGDTAVAAAFGFEDNDTYYLYNSAYDTRHGDASPGNVLVELAMRQAVSSGRDRIDFLKGDEAYKYRLGAHPRRLHRVTAAR
jgi:CelD/BcsL family acetyltransferase involved in cellulose biosynthesis